MKWKEVGSKAVHRCDLTKDLSELYSLHCDILGVQRKLAKIVFDKDNRKRFDNLFFVKNFWIKQMEEKIEKFHTRYGRSYEPDTNKTKSRFAW